jgi:hypothetical protein
MSPTPIPSPDEPERITDVRSAHAGAMIQVQTSTGRGQVFLAQVVGGGAGSRIVTPEGDDWRPLEDDERALLGSHPAALAFARAHGSSEDLWIAEPAPAPPPLTTEEADALIGDPRDDEEAERAKRDRARRLPPLAGGSGDALGEVIGLDPLVVRTALDVAAEWA